MAYLMGSRDSDSDNVFFHRVNHKKKGSYSKKKAKRLMKTIKQSRRNNRKHK